MASLIQSNFRIRKNLGKVQQIIQIPNLIDIQKSSYDKFLQSNIKQDERVEVGLQAVFRSVFPIKDFNGTSELVFVSYNLEPPKYDVEECRQRGTTFLIVTHDDRLAARCDRIIRLVDGRIVSDERRAPAGAEPE